MSGPRKRRSERRTRGWALAVALAVAAAAAAAPPATVPPSARPAAARGTTVVPDRFLRRWDPLTVFFAADTGPGTGMPEDRPERYVTVDPAQPGAFTWLDARTLQFRPAEPWPPLARVTVRAGGRSFHLATLLEPPVATEPRDGSEGLDPVEAITLTFAEPLPPEALARAVSIELRPLPGVGDGSAARWLGPDDLEVKVVERKSRSAKASYVLALDRPVPLGTRATVHFRLSLDDDLAGGASVAEASFSTAEPFRAVALGCRTHRYPLTPEGTRYTPEQAIRCDPDDRAVMVELSAAPRPLGPVEGRNLVRLTPSVANLEYRVSGRTLEVHGDFARDTRYRVALTPPPPGARVTTADGRPLRMTGSSEVYLYFPRQAPFLTWQASGGIVERFGPQMVPVSGRGEDRLDLRIQRVDPLDRSFWPFPGQPVTVDEGRRPPGPGEEPAPFADVQRNPTGNEIAARVAALGSPPVSQLVELPLRREGGSATFGLDLIDPLAKIAGKGAGGTYLVGLRRLDGPARRTWMRVQVTDLALSTVEEPRRVIFVVTSLATGRPVADAAVEVQATVFLGGSKGNWETVFSGRTDADGRLVWEVPGDQPSRGVEVRRLVVRRGDDSLVLDAGQAPDAYADNHWSESRDTWLDWAFRPLVGRGPQEEEIGHLFSERPVYRPEEPVHLKGYLRIRDRGHLSPYRQKGFLVVSGPGDLEWRYPVTPSANGTFYHLFDEKKLPTGVYSAYFETVPNRHRLGSVSFRKEAYRLPRFQVDLHGPDRTSLDADFEIALTATYYAGGRVAARPVDWRVTQFPYTFRPKKRPGFFYSSDGRFSRTGRFESRPAFERHDTTDADGGAALTVNPALEPTAQPRTYVIEATVTGADDQTVTSTRRVVALPPFLLGLKVPRYLPRAETLHPEILVLGPDDKLLAGQEVTVRLLERQWHSHLRASDFSDGVARYETEVVDEKVSETRVKSGEAPVALDLPLPEAGVYIVELEAHDRLGRAQVVAVDLFAGGEEPVTWERPSTAVFQVAPDRTSYRPGDTAHLVLESPFQEGRALAVTEAPEGNRYRWLDVAGGKATLDVPILGTYAPRLPVHFLLLRGRVPGTRPVPGSSTDLGKPATLGATAWLPVEPLDNRLEVKLDYPPKSLPGKEIEVGIELSDPDGRPLPGEVTLWLVDQAVLALGHEQRLDPVPTFVTPVRSHLEIRDTRGLAFGYLPFAEQPGGGAPARAKSLFDRQTVRRTFQPVPFYAPAIEVGPDGRATVQVQLPDNLTNFELRAKAVSGAERFGFGTGHLEVRLPVIVQPALPRFVRAGDRFVASAVGRLVEGGGGPGTAEARFDGVELEGPATRELTWLPDRPVRLDFPVSVPSPTYDARGELSRREVVFRVAVERSTDGAGDAFEVKLPIEPDRDRVVRRLLEELARGTPVPLPDAEGEVRPGTLRRSLLVSDRPELVRMAAGLDFFLAYPYGCTEQRLSEARARLALAKFRDLLGEEGGREELDRAVEGTLAWIPQVVQPDGLCAYWPGSPGYVSLTAWTVEFLVEAKEAGYPVDADLLAGLTRALEQALRSDYSGFIDGEAWAERTWALRALARAGRFDPAYAAELARRAQFLDLDSVAGVLLALDDGGEKSSPAVPALLDELRRGIVVRLFQGKEIYGGLQTRQHPRNGLILPSETRTVADMFRALHRLAPAGPREAVMRDALVRLGRGDGWGSTNANAAALLALAEVVQPQTAAGGPSQKVEVDLPGGSETVTLSSAAPAARRVTTAAGAGRVTLLDGPGPVVARAEISYLPAADGSRAPARRDGFVVSRELLAIEPDGKPPVRHPLTEPATTLTFAVGRVVEDHVQVVTPEDHHYVAVVVPLAAGMEPLNPQLATAPPEARPDGRLTLAPTYAAYLDDRVAFYYDTLPKGTYDFYFRTRATVPGSFIQPGAKAEMMYDASVVGTSPGARVVVERREE